VWPLRRRAHPVIRVCRERVELWTREADGLVLTAQQTLESPASLAALEPALMALLTGNPRAANAAFDVVLESAWLPVLPLDAGTALWSSAQMKALLTHRLAQVYAEENGPTTWLQQLDYRPGDAHGVGYALAPSVNDALACTAIATECRWRSLQPAFRWGWDTLVRRRRDLPAKTWTCWVWLEQDRALAAMVHKRRIVALNPAAGLPRDEAALMRLAVGEALCWGVDPNEVRVVAAGWQTQAPPTTTDSTAWLSVAAHAAALSTPIQSTTAAGSPA